ncbi:YdeI family protein [Saccharicrinis sp. FJH62]|uniref:YdeI/OmpD-associated family protein n=1 Tax=Saccharicrinis sp. FJH62 TaxID=3344657 RepID=UPI0035D48DFA
MALNSLALFFHDQTVLLSRNSELTKEKQSNKNIHKLRLSIKSIKSILKILESENSVQIDKQAIYDQLIPPFKTAGSLREQKVNLKLTKKFNLTDITELNNFLQQKVFEAEKELKPQIDNLNETDLKKCCRSISLFINSTDFTTLTQIILKSLNERSDQIKMLTEKPDATIPLHKIRRYLKDIDFALTWLSNSYVFVPGINMETVNALGRIIGRWHDIVVFKNELKEFESTFPKLQLNTEKISETESELRQHIIRTLNEIHFVPESKIEGDIFLWFKTRKDYRDWLLVNHDKCKRFRMVFYKKHTGKSNIEYNDAVEESLCFGWIDSLVRRVNDDIYTRKFTPRNLRSRWSPTNIKRVEKMLNTGMVEASGLKTLPIDPATGQPDWNKVTVSEMEKKVPDIPDHIKTIFKQHEPAWTNFTNLADSYKRQYILWITAAKTDATRNKRIKTSLQLLKENKKPGMI